jgi:hypothetical protein
MSKKPTKESVSVLHSELYTTEAKESLKKAEADLSADDPTNEEDVKHLLSTNEITS